MIPTFISSSVQSMSFPNLLQLLGTETNTHTSIPWMKYDPMFIWISFFRCCSPALDLFAG